MATLIIYQMCWIAKLCNDMLINELGATLSMLSCN